MAREIVKMRLDENEGKIRELKKLQKKMQSALDDRSKMKDSMPDGDSVCQLIESLNALRLRNLRL